METFTIETDGLPLFTLKDLPNPAVIYEGKTQDGSRLCLEAFGGESAVIEGLRYDTWLILRLTRDCDGKTWSTIQSCNTIYSSDREVAIRDLLSRVPRMVEEVLCKDLDGEVPQKPDDFSDGHDPRSFRARIYADLSRVRVSPCTGPSGE